MAQVLAIDANYDTLTRYGQAFRNKYFLDNFSETFPQHELIRVNDSEVEPDNIRKLLAEENIKFISAVGHGTDTVFTGHNRVPLWRPGSDLSLLSGKFVHLLSCRVGGKLAVNMMHHGVHAFWGYSSGFRVHHSPQEPLVLTDDPIPGDFLELDAIIDLGILSGRSASEIYGSMCSFFARIYNTRRMSPARRVDLYSNIKFLVHPCLSYGGPQARLGA